MAKTKLTIKGNKFYINGDLTYSEIENGNPETRGLLMNARFIQGIFDDQADPDRFNRFGRTFDPDKNTDDLISALPEWYSYGLRAFTVGFQGGGPCFTTSNQTIHNNPFGQDGKSLDPAYAQRMKRLINAADELGMVVIVSYFYGDQARRLKDGQAVVNAVKTASNFLRDNEFSNVIIEVANEHNIGAFDKHPLIKTAEGMSLLIDIARKESGGLPVGSSGGGGYVNEEVCRASDVILIHGNGQTRQQYYKMIQKAKEWCPQKPIVCNEDSQSIGQLAVAYQTRTSWGYYNNMTKQEPPADWSITEGEDKFFALRMADGLGIKTADDIKEEDQYYLQGREPEMEYQGKRWLRLASLYPEKVDYVEFYKNDDLEYTSYDEPYTVNFKTTWAQGPIEADTADQWKAIVHLRTGETKTIN
ncbi:MAG: hypothetical protein ACOCQ1_00910 [Halanaerobiaceae bacterium]